LDLRNPIRLAKCHPKSAEIAHLEPLAPLTLGVGLDVGFPFVVVVLVALLAVTFSSMNFAACVPYTCT
jgi:hypothetical protein